MGITLRGQYKFSILCPNKKTRLIVASNLITTVGKTVTAKILSEQFLDPVFQYFVFGDANTAPSITDTKLSSEVGRVEVTTKSSVNNVTTLTATIFPSEFVGYSLQEIGVVGVDATGSVDTGHLFSRALIDPVINKTEVMQVNVTYTLTVS